MQKLTNARTIVTRFILDVWQGSEYAFALHNNFVRDKVWKFSRIILSKKQFRSWNFSPSCKDFWCHGWSTVHEEQFYYLKSWRHTYIFKPIALIARGTEFLNWVLQKPFDDGSFRAGIGEFHT